MDTNNITERRRILRRYLQQYFRAKERKSILKKREKAILLELGGESCGVDVSEKITEIKARIQSQTEVEASAVISVMDMINFLPIGSTERNILELRHIDFKSWAEIQRTLHLTRSPCYDYYNRGLDAILTNHTAIQALEKFIMEKGDGSAR